MAEVIKVVGSNVYVQVFESTRGLKVGAEAEFTGHMLEAVSYTHLDVYKRQGFTHASRVAAWS